MKTKKLILFLAAMLIMLMAIPATAGALVDYTITAPSTSGDVKLPVVYVLPHDGYKQHIGFADKLDAAADKGLGMNMIIVEPEFEAGMDLRAEMNTLVAHIDEKYNTIADPSGRAIVGTGAGGYLAYVLGMVNSDGDVSRNPAVYSFVASVNGNFVNNAWYATYGDVYDKIKAAGSSSVGNYFTYMDAPVDGQWTNDEGSTNDLGYMFINFGTGANAHEYTARPGTFTEAFQTESANRIADRIATKVLSGIASGSVAANPGVISEDTKTAKVEYSVKLSRSLSNFTSGSVKVVPTISLIDPATGKVLDSEKGASLTLSANGSATGSVTLDNKVTGSSGTLQLTVSVMGYSMDLATANLVVAQNPTSDKVDLMGDWYFRYYGSRTNFRDAQINALLDSKEYLDTTVTDDGQYWSIVQPTLGNWENGYGNICQATVGYPPSSFMFGYMITGSGYYVKEFTIPSSFDASNPVVTVGKVDDRCEVWINGVHVGATGLDASGEPTGETTWAVFSAFDVDPSILNIGGKNNIVVRAWNDTPGAGGWNSGPVALWSGDAYAAEFGDGWTARFYEETFYSAALGRDNEYLIYLPEDYFESDYYYPTMYLMHQFNSDHTSYQSDKIDQLMDEAAKKAAEMNMIVVIPNSAESSWWRGEWEDMVTDDLIPHIEANYRSIPDARYRMTAGCSMGGQGAFGMALCNPNYFSGAASFFGAFSMGGERSPNQIVEKEPVEYMDYFEMAFICGNQDSYSFGMPAIQLNQQLEDIGIDHFFLIDNGGHDSAFYVPFFYDTVSYVRKNMFNAQEDINAKLTAKPLIATEVNVLESENGTITAEIVLTADEALKAYFHEIPDSPYTLDTNPGVTLPFVVKIDLGSKARSGEYVHTFNATFNDEKMVVTETIDLTGVVSSADDVKGNMTIKTQLLGRENTAGNSKLETLEIKYPQVDLPNTGDESNIALYAFVLLASAAMLVIVSRKKARI